MLSLETSAFIIIMLTGLGYFCLGSMVQLKKVHKLRLRIIALEFDLAKLEKRPSRTVDEILETPIFNENNITDKEYIKGYNKGI